MRHSYAHVITTERGDAAQPGVPAADDAGDIQRPEADRWVLHEAFTHPLELLQLS
ncbi:hypothetical protein ACWFMI_00585 [Nocardiopsis terrae]